MAENPIKYSDIISTDVPEGIKDLIALIAKLDKAADETRQRILELGKQLQKNSNDNADGIKKQEAAIRGLSEEEKQLIAIEKKRAKAELEIQRTIKLQNQAAELAIKNTSSQGGAYKNLSTQLNKLRREYKDLAASEDIESDKAKEMLKNIRKLDDKLKKIDATVGQHQRNVGKYGQAWERAKTTIKGWGVAALAAVTVSGAFNKAIEYSGTLADSFQKGMAQANAGLGVFFTTIATGSWGGFWDRLTGSVRAAGELAEAMDRIDDMRMAMQRGDIETEIKAQKLINELKLNYDNRIKREALIKEIDALYLSRAEKKAALAKEEYTYKIKLLAAASGISERATKDFIENFENNAQLNAQAERLNQLKEMDVAHGKVQADFDEEARLRGIKGLVTYAYIYEKIQAQEKLRIDAFNASTLELQTQKELLDQQSRTIRQQVSILKEKDKDEKTKDGTSIAKSKYDEEIEIEKNLLEQLEQSDKQQIKSLEKTSVEISDTTRKGMLEQIGIVEDGNAAISLSNEKTGDEAVEEQRKTNAEILKEKEEFFATSESIANSFFQAENAIREMRKQKELQAAGDDLELQKKINKEYARRERNMAVFQITLSTAMAVAKIAATQGYPAGIPATIAVLAEGAAQLITVEAQYQGLKFKKGGHGVIYGKNKEMDKTYIPGVGYAGSGEYFSIFNKQATEKHQPLISDFTDAVNQNKLDLFALNFIPKIFPANNDKLSDIAIQQLQVQKQTKEILSKQKILRGKTEIDLNGNRTHYC